VARFHSLRRAVRATGITDSTSSWPRTILETCKSGEDEKNDGSGGEGRTSRVRDCKDGIKTVQQREWRDSFRCEIEILGPGETRTMEANKRNSFLGDSPKTHPASGVRVRRSTRRRGGRRRRRGGIHAGEGRE
jgi:hypothetical protein